MSELIINFASRGRYDQFFRSLRNLDETISTEDYTIFASFDYGDVMDSDEVRERIKNNYPKVKVIYGDHYSKVDAINRTGKYFGKFHWLVNHSDDMVYLEYGWDKKMMDKIRGVWGNSTDFLASFNDGFVGGKLPTLHVCGYDYYHRFGYIYHNSYGSVSCDAEVYFISQMLGCYHYFPEIYFNHIHPANVRFESDATYRGNDKWGQLDTDNYFARMKRLFDVQNPVTVPEELLSQIK